MKFGETFAEYLHSDHDGALNKFSHVEYKRLKKVLKSCRSCRLSESEEICGGDGGQPPYECQSCPLCDQKFFTELMKEASDISGCFQTKVRRLLRLHVATGIQKCIMFLLHCFRDDQQLMLQEGKMLIEYITMNAIAMRKIIKKYDKVHGSVTGKNFRSKMRAKHIELLQSPWLIELGAFCMNFKRTSNECTEGSGQFSFDFDAARPVMTMSLPDSIKLECDLTCAVCLDIVFNPYALSCGHLFCEPCACSAASVMVFQGLKAANKDARCPICREAGVYANSVHMEELKLLVKNRCKDYWKGRKITESAEMVKQSKQYWDLQTKYAAGF